MIFLFVYHEIWCRYLCTLYVNIVVPNKNIDFLCPSSVCNLCQEQCELFLLVYIVWAVEHRACETLIFIILWAIKFDVNNHRNFNGVSTLPFSTTYIQPHVCRMLSLHDRISSRFEYINSCLVFKFWPNTGKKKTENQSNRIDKGVTYCSMPAPHTNNSR